MFCDKHGTIDYCPICIEEGIEQEEKLTYDLRQIVMAIAGLSLEDLKILSKNIDDLLYSAWLEQVDKKGYFSKS